MIAELTNWILSFMQAHGQATVFIGVIIESIIVPIPSPLIIMSAGALLIDVGCPAHLTLIQIVSKIVIPGSIASTLGAYFAFAIAFWGGKLTIDRFHRFLGFSWEDVLWMEKKLEGRVNMMIFLLRALPIVPLSLISAAAGVLRLPVFPFTIWTFAGALPRCLVLGYLGFLTRNSYRGLAGQINALETIISIVIIVGVFMVIIWLRFRMKNKSL